MDLLTSSKVAGAFVEILREIPMKETLTPHWLVGPLSAPRCFLLLPTTGNPDKLTSRLPFAKVHRNDLYIWSYPNTIAPKVAPIGPG